jgi:hypothetical protein
VRPIERDEAGRAAPLEPDVGPVRARRAHALAHR